MLRAIVGAKESIYLEMYIFEKDTIGYDFLHEIELKALSGIRVIIILDALGSFSLAEDAIERLKSVGAEVLFFTYWFRRTHRKILIIDEWTVFLGGVNIAGQFSRWKDLQVRVSGRIARIAVRSFAHIYHECGGKNPALSFVNEPRIFGHARAWFLDSGVREKFHKLKKHYEKHIDSAMRDIMLVTPYLIPHPWIITHLHRALQRGVNVTIIIPRSTDHPYIDRINYFYADRFEKIGVHVLLGRGMNHAKVMLIDNSIATIGSQNLDTLSFDWNVEAGIFFDDVHMIGELKEIVSEWATDAEDFETLAYLPRWYDHAIAFILRLFERTP